MQKILAVLGMALCLAACGVAGEPDFPPGSSYPGNYPSE